MNGEQRVRLLEQVRVGYGAALIAAPERVLEAVGARADRPGRVVARILGARHVLQGLASGWRPSPEVLAMGVWVDTVHALTAAALAVGDEERRSIALLDAALAGTWAAAGNRDLAVGRVPPPSRERRRDALARLVLGRAPGGDLLLARARAARRRSRVGDSAVVRHLR